MVGEFESARTYSDQAREIFADLGHTAAAVHTRAVLGDIELLAGDADAARRQYETLCRFCEENGEFGLLSTYAADLATSLHERGGRGRRALESGLPVTCRKRRHQRPVRLAGRLGQRSWRGAETWTKPSASRARLSSWRTPRMPSTSAPRCCSRSPRCFGLDRTTRQTTHSPRASRCTSARGTSRRARVDKARGPSRSLSP